jgi:hypothetical protein
MEYDYHKLLEILISLTPHNKCFTAKCFTDNEYFPSVLAKVAIRFPAPNTRNLNMFTCFHSHSLQLNAFQQ